MFRRNPTAEATRHSDCRDVSALPTAMAAIIECWVRPFHDRWQCSAPRAENEGEKAPMTTRRMPFAAACAGLFDNSATNVPIELADARVAYQRARTGSAAQIAPAELLVAKKALAEAEQAFQRDPDSSRTRDLAHVARRISEMAEATASIALDREIQSLATGRCPGTRVRALATAKKSAG